jgi:hypothetical protein
MYLTCLYLLYTLVLEEWAQAHVLFLFSSYEKGILFVKAILIPMDGYLYSPMTLHISPKLNIYNNIYNIP